MGTEAEETQDRADLAGAYIVGAARQLGHSEPLTVCTDLDSSGAVRMTIIDDGHVLADDTSGRILEFLEANKDVFDSQLGQMVSTDREGRVRPRIGAARQDTDCMNSLETQSGPLSISVAISKGRYSAIQARIRVAGSQTDFTLNFEIGDSWKFLAGGSEITPNALLKTAAKRLGFEGEYLTTVSTNYISGETKGIFRLSFQSNGQQRSNETPTEILAKYAGKHDVWLRNHLQGLLTTAAKGTVSETSTRHRLEISDGEDKEQAVFTRLKNDGPFFGNIDVTYDLSKCLVEEIPKLFQSIATARNEESVIRYAETTSGKLFGPLDRLSMRNHVQLGQGATEPGAIVDFSDGLSEAAAASLMRVVADFRTAKPTIEDSKRDLVAVGNVEGTEDTLSIKSRWYTDKPGVAMVIELKH